MSFLAAYFDLLDVSKENAVCCPFDHHLANGMAYKESHPSAHVNVEKGVFHCKVCGVGHTETSFAQNILRSDLIFTKRLLKCFENEEDVTEWDRYTTLSDEARHFINSFGISDTVIDELKLRSDEPGTMQFPVFMYEHLVDIRKYKPHVKPKVKSRTYSPVGLILPYDLWRETPKSRVTLICAGEKDMAVARTHGFNAITITGGEQTLPKVLSEFVDRTVVILYDNDEAGKSGAVKLANALTQIAKKVKVVTGFHEVCKESGEDITDFFTKYNKTKEDLLQYIKDTPDFVPTIVDDDTQYPIINLLTASRAEYVNKIVRSNIQVVATDESSYITPTAIYASKFDLADSGNTMLKGATKEWELTAQNVQDVLHLIDNNFKEETIQANIRALLKIPLKEKFVSIKTCNKQTVHKAYVTDLFESASNDLVAMEYTAYTLGVKLESGKRYLVTYKIVPHPYKGQRLTMIITNAVQANDSVSNFAVNETTKEHLNVFRNLEGTVPERVQYLTECVKGMLGYNGNNTLIQAMDLSYHTVLQFHFGSFKNERGYLDTLIIGESRMGKSSTANALRSMYELGVFTSLAGNAATVAGLIGGSNKVGGSYQTRAGLIPQNHKGLIIFEEFGKSNNNIITELTDIRSSNEVRVTRVAGTLTMPAVVRMITLTNVKTSDGTIKPIASYPNGITIATELIGTAEDIARYDMIVILSDRGASQIDPFWEPPPPLPKEVYQSRIRWIWSREPDQIKISREVGLHIMEQANALNKDYDTHIKIFGTEAWKKLTRLSVAIAGYLVSTDDTYNDIIVTKEHVDYAVQFLISIYDNSTFKLKEYVAHEKQFATLDEAGLSVLQDLYIKCPTLLLQLEQCSKTSKNMLSAATGLVQDELNKLLTQLTRSLFIRFSNHDILPTERFRLGMSQINRNTRVPRIGEGNA